MKCIINVVAMLLVVSAVVVLLTTFVFPTLRINGTSMAPTLKEGDVSVAVKEPHYHTGDIVAFDHNDKVLVKRVICGPGDWIDIQNDGTVYVNNQKLDEPYVLEPGLGNCDVELPYQVPEDSYFVMGDQRTTSVDSRMREVGCVPADHIMGKVVACVWPFGSMGLVK